MDPTRHQVQTTHSVNGLVSLWRAVRKYWMAAIGVALFVFLGFTFYTLGQTKIYSAVAILQFDPRPPRPLGKGVQTVVDMGVGDYWNTHEYYETQYRVVTSNRVAVAVVKQLGLNQDPLFLANLPADAVTDVATTTPQKAAQILLTRYVVEPVPESRLAKLKYEDADPARAQRVLAALLDVYMEQNLEAALESTNQAVDWLRLQLAKIKDELNSSELKLYDFKDSNQILSVSLDDRSNMLREELRELSIVLTRVRAKRAAAAGRRLALRRIRVGSARRMPDNQLINSTLLPSLRRNYEDALRARNSLLAAGKGKKHVQVLAAARAVKTSHRAIVAEVRNIQQAADSELRAIGSEEGSIVALLRKAEKRAHLLSKLEIGYNRLRRSRDHNEKLYTYLLERTKETDLQRMLRVNNIRVLDYPQLPEIPIRPKVSLMLILAALAGLGLGLACAVVLSMLDRTIKTPDDVEEKLGMVCLGVLPDLQSPTARKARYARRRGKRVEPPTGPAELIVHSDPTSGTAEAARALRTNLMFMSPDDPYKTLLVTSAGPAEGKTTVACCIATAMAQVGMRVLLMDCDLRRARVHRVFGTSGDKGITSALLDDVMLSDEEMKTEVENLFVLPAGPIPPNPAEIFHSERFKRMLGKLQKRFDRIVIDSSPVLPVTDATILSTHVDFSVVVVRSHVTRTEAARRALRLILDVCSTDAGVVVNAFNITRHDEKYLHYYGYERYGYEPRDDDDRGMTQVA
jgi:capsular exopolysaccharide synthesis family protein